MARLIDRFVGHTQQLKQLMQMREHGRLPHAMLFVGPSGVGKKTAALVVAQSLVCENTVERPCGLCGPCLRMEKQQSESLYNIQPDPEFAKPAIKVEDIRGLLERLALAPIGLARIVIIDQAHLMNEQASNALLKTLEEPSPNLFFFLIANEASQLLPTIRSRVQTMRFSGLVYEHLHQLKPGLPDWAYRSSRGQLDRLEQLTNKQGLAERQEALALLEQFCFDDDFLLRDEWRKSFKDDRAWALFNMGCWIQMLRDTLILKTDTNKFILNTDQNELLKKLYTLSVNKLLWLVTQLVQSMRDTRANQDVVLIFDSLRVKYARVD